VLINGSHEKIKTSNREEFQGEAGVAIRPGKSHQTVGKRKATAKIGERARYHRKGTGGGTRRITPKTQELRWASNKEKKYHRRDRNSEKKRHGPHGEKKKRQNTEKKKNKKRVLERGNYSTVLENKTKKST